MTDVSEQQRANLAQLAAYLRTLPADYPDFAMDQYVRGEKGTGMYTAHVPECGTAACAAGHGPAAGIAPLPDEGWAEYSTRAFVEPLDAWCWCFDQGWHRVDNTAHGAAARIEWLLANGVPDDASAQRHGRSPLCYLSLLTAPRAGEGVDRG